MEALLPQGWLRQLSVSVLRIRMEFCHPTASSRACTAAGARLLTVREVATSE